MADPILGVRIGGRFKQFGNKRILMDSVISAMNIINYFIIGQDLSCDYTSD